MAPELEALPALARAEALHPALREHVLRPSRGPFAEFTHFLLIDSGEVSVATETGELRFAGPVALIIPSSPAARLTLGAGAPGWLLGVAPNLLAEAVGSKAESGLIHRLSGRLTVARDSAGLLSDFLFHAGRIERELSVANRGSQMAVAAHVRLLLIAFWREGGLEPDVIRGRGNEAHLMQGFRRLVELHFRNQLSVAGYAALLGLSYDRLHAICGRTMGRSPLQLVHQRLMREAAIRLERSGETIQEIAHSLGFSDPSQFSHFFKRNGRLAPSAFRDAVRRSGNGLGDAPQSMADWP